MYRISNYSGKIQKVSTSEIFDQDDRLPQWKDFNKWQKEGGVSEYVDFFGEEEIEYNRQFLPKVVSQRQLRTQLVLNGFDLNDIQLAINELSEPNKAIAQIAWDYAITFERDSPLLMCLASNLGLTVDEVDTIFLNASKL